MHVGTDRASYTDAGRIPIKRGTDIRRLVAELATLRRCGLDVCIGHYTAAISDPADSSPTAPEAAPVHVGRIGLTDAPGTPLLVDWRTPAAEPFCAATHAYSSGVTHPGSTGGGGLQGSPAQGRPKRRTREAASGD
ncbi:hypothetical protein [Dietzia sp. Die43]|uniref:hypothetical protein n=1 Tax=Dietzia sp. Die43 TaxID=2926011 RepID=UPI0021174B25|nr:hypothetical protein [Dietzia sp. Die43]